MKLCKNRTRLSDSFVLAACSLLAWMDANGWIDSEKQNPADLNVEDYLFWRQQLFVSYWFLCQGNWDTVTHHITALMWPVSPCLNPCALALCCPLTLHQYTQFAVRACVCVCVCQVTWFCRMTCCNRADADTFNCERRGHRGARGGFSQHAHTQTCRNIAFIMWLTCLLTTLAETGAE